MKFRSLNLLMSLLFFGLLCLPVDVKAGNPYIDIPEMQHELHG